MDACRICKNNELQEVLDLGQQYHTGLFLGSGKGMQIPSARLRLVKCDNRLNKKYCGLVQLDHTLDLDLMYGQNYGYRSGLNLSMVNHLELLVNTIINEYRPSKGDAVLDIGCNDGTTLRYFGLKELDIYGIDPTSEKFKEFHPPLMRFKADFFSRNVAEKLLQGRRPKIITSFSMLYDLEDPNSFFTDVGSIMSEETVWVSEQSYLPTMLKNLAYDTICHEHIEYYGLEQLEILAARNGMKIIDSFMTDTNGGSIVTVFALQNSNRSVQKRHWTLLEKESELGLTSFKELEAFRQKVLEHRDIVTKFFEHEISRGRTFAGLGASTKGNVILQFMGLTTKYISEIGEVNPDKIGTLTPGSGIPISEENEVISKSYDYYVVLPWHFRDFFCNNKVYSGLKLVFLCPDLSIVSVPQL